jgi:hypothetical protein
MWLSWPAFLVIVAAIIGGIIGGGIFTIVLVPLAGLAVVALVALWLFSRATGAGGVGTTTEPIGPGGSALPHRRGDSGAHARTSPERLADLRREQQ